MIAYKFRSSSQIEFALDILFNQRLYCADWATLNDPMEGSFVFCYSDAEAEDRKRAIAAVIREKQHLRVASLSRTFDRHLLWAHYASGFSGLAVEVELPEDSPFVRPIQYGSVFVVLPSEQMSPDEAATRGLSSKFQEWSYEREVRVLFRGEWFQLESLIRRVIVGHRMNPALFKALRIVCERLQVPINRTGIGDEGIDADHVPLLAEEGLARRVVQG